MVYSIESDTYACSTTIIFFIIIVSMAGTHDYLVSNIDGGVWLASYCSLSEDVPLFFPQAFKAEADNVLRMLGVQCLHLTATTAEPIHRVLITLII